MANSSGINQPVRSISLPSRLHPSTQKIEAELNRLRTRIISTPNSENTPSEALQNALARLQDLYCCVEELTRSPSTQQALGGDRITKQVVEEALDGSVGLIDVCASARDFLFTMKDHVQDIQSALRRRGRDHSCIQTNINAYLCFRKKMKKDISKRLRSLKSMEISFSNNVASFRVVDVNHHPSMAVRVLRELTSITVSIFQNLLFYLSATDHVAARPSFSGCPFVSKLSNSIISFAASHDLVRSRKAIVNEVASVDVSLSTELKRSDQHQAEAAVQVLVQERLDSLTAGILCLESRLQCLFRHLIQHRVCLLNLLKP